VGDLIHDTELHHSFGKKPERPTVAPLRGIAADQGHEDRLLLSVQLAWLSRTMSVIEGPFQPSFHELLSRPLDRRAAQVESGGDGLIGEAVVGQQENVRAAKLPGPGVPLSDQLQELPALRLCQVDDVRLVHEPPSQLPWPIRQDSSERAIRHY
jgi:hypothetical protein